MTLKGMTRATPGFESTLCHEYCLCHGHDSGKLLIQLVGRTKDRQARNIRTVQAYWRTNQQEKRRCQKRKIEQATISEPLKRSPRTGKSRSKNPKATFELITKALRSWAEYLKWVHVSLLS